MIKIRHTSVDNWHYVAIGRWEPFKFLGCSSWICASPRWLWIRISYEVKRFFKVQWRKASDGSERG